jgi:hypothetical protein
MALAHGQGCYAGLAGVMADRLKFPSESYGLTLRLVYTLSGRSRVIQLVTILIALAQRLSSVVTSKLRKSDGNSCL